MMMGHHHERYDEHKYKIQDLTRLACSRLYLDALMNIAAALERTVRVERQHPK